MKNVLMVVIVLSAAVLAAVGGGLFEHTSRSRSAGSNENVISDGDAGKSVASSTRWSVVNSEASAPTPHSTADEPNQHLDVLRGSVHFVGSAVCASCHPAQSEAYRTSHHAKALVDTSSQATTANLDGAHFSSKLGGATTFSHNEKGTEVRTLVAKSQVSRLSVPYVSGVWPLQQFVVATERGKLQSLGVVWDSRTPEMSGQRWFHVYGGDGIAPGDSLFFTHAAQNWNHMCADCHSTWVSRGYDVASDSFDTKWTELSVGCEACHGPGKQHVESAQQGRAPVKFIAALAPAKPWSPSATGSPTPRPQRGTEVETCAPCHSRRAPLAEGFLAGESLLDHFEPELLWAGRYHADGQVEGEVYEWGSFTQSRMYQAGVTCSDCHNPHSGKPYATGDALCMRCHEPARFQVPAHSQHTGVNAPGCVDCHMPKATFMQVDERRDHSIRIPRPDHSVAFGTPNACSQCHTKQDAKWAREWTRKWYPTLEERQHFVHALGAERLGEEGAPLALRELSSNVAAPAIARATALERLGANPNAKTLEVLRKAAAGDERGVIDEGSRALIAYGAALGAAQLPPKERTALLVPLLEHDARAVRVTAGKALAAVPIASLPVTSLQALERAFVEVEQSFAVNASRAETHVEQSAFEMSRGRFAQAEAALATAHRLEPCLAEAHLNAAELSRQRQDETSALRSIQAALSCNPRSAAAHHALGLLHVRTKSVALAIASLTKAVELAPTDARFSYVLAVALASASKADVSKLDAAVAVLEASLIHHPNDVPSLQVLYRYLQGMGQNERARSIAQRLERLLRD